MNASSSDDDVDTRVAERRAAKIASDWERLNANRQALEQHKARELAEAEARSLAQIKTDTERALANQLQALRDAERAAELAAIERRMADLEAVKEAERRTALDLEATQLAQARREADHCATLAAEERKVVSDKAAAARKARLAIEREALAARRGKRKARAAAAWAAFRAAPPLAVGIVALAIGALVGYVAVAVPRAGLLPTDVTEAPLKLEMELKTSESR